MVTIIMGMMTIRLLEPDKFDNYIYVCPSCDIAARELELKLYNKTQQDPAKNKVACPNCEKTVRFEINNNRATPLSPKLSLWQRRKLHKVLNNSIISADADGQLLKYVELQENKLNIMKKEIAEKGN